MKKKIKILKEVELEKIIVKAGVRYWADCEYSEDNGQTWVEAKNDDEAIDEQFKQHIPFIEKENIGYKDNDYWNLTIDINTGKVKGWPKGYCISTHFKVCDDGLYQIIDNEGNVVWDSIKNESYYVPGFLSIEDTGYGDYIYIDIDGEGYIKNWKSNLYNIERLFIDENDD